MSGFSLETARLRIRPVDERDAAFVLSILTDPGFMKYVGDRGVRTEEQALRYIEERLLPFYRRDGIGAYRVSLKETDEAVGLSTLIKRDYLEDADIGFAYLPAQCRKGYAHEASVALLAYAKETLGFIRVSGITIPENTPSIKLLEKLGLRFEKMIHAPGDARETCLYAMNLVS